MQKQNNFQIHLPIKTLEICEEPARDDKAAVMARLVESQLQMNFSLTSQPSLSQLKDELKMMTKMEGG